MEHQSPVKVLDQQQVSNVPSDFKEEEDEKDSEI
jgi:hypothetical protein